MIIMIIISIVRQPHLQIVNNSNKNNHEKYNNDNNFFVLGCLFV